MEVEEKIRREGHVVGKQKPPPPASEDDEREGKIQNRLLQEAQPQRQLGRHLDQGREIQLPNPLFDVPANPEKSRWIRAVQNEFEEKAQQEIPHPRSAGR